MHDLASTEEETRTEGRMNSCGFFLAIKTLFTISRRKAKNKKSKGSQIPVVPLAKEKGRSPSDYSNASTTASCRTLTIPVVAGGTSDLGTVLLEKPRAVEDLFFVFEDVVGSGMSGQIQLVACKQTGSLCALKRFKLCDKASPSLQSDTLVKYAKNEVEIHSSLNHPNIVKVIDICECACEIILVTELGRGGNLFSYLSSVRRLSETDAICLVGQMLAAVSYLHDEAGVVHRDLKLENWVFASFPGKSDLKLIDFGLSLGAYREGVTMSECLGTAYYCAPEVAVRRPYTHKCDNWSLGVITYMLLTGRPPVQGSSDRVILEKLKLLWRLSEKIFPWRVNRVWTRLSCTGRDFVEKLLTIDPDERTDLRTAMNHPWQKGEALPLSMEG